MSDQAEDTYTPPQAARILRLSRRRIIQMLNAGELEGYQDPESGRWSGSWTKSGKPTGRTAAYWPRL